MAIFAISLWSLAYLWGSRDSRHWSRITYSLKAMSCRSPFDCCSLETASMIKAWVFLTSRALELRVSPSSWVRGRVFVFRWMRCSLMAESTSSWNYWSKILKSGFPWRSCCFRFCFPLKLTCPSPVIRKDGAMGAGVGFISSKVAAACWMCLSRKFSICCCLVGGAPLEGLRKENMPPLLFFWGGAFYELSEEELPFGWPVL